MSQDLENIVKNAFENFEADVSPEVWTNIQQGISVAPQGPSAGPGNVAAVTKSAGIISKFSAILTVSSLTVITAFVGWYYTSQTTLPVTADQPATAVEAPAPAIDAGGTAAPVIENQIGSPEASTAFNGQTARTTSTTKQSDNQKTTITESESGMIPASTSASANDVTHHASSDAAPVKSSSEKTPEPQAASETATSASANEAKDLIEKFNEKPAAYIVANPVVGNAPLTVNFLNNGYAKSVTWNFGEGSSDKQPQTSHTFETPGVYEVILIATDENNITFTDRIRIEVKADEGENLSSVAEIQNVFTPNGDGYNDVFKVNGTNLASLNGEIYHVSGKRVFRWSDPEDGWDGKLTRGINAEEDTYFYIIEATGKDGKVYLFKGAVRLIK